MKPGYQCSVSATLIHQAIRPATHIPACHSMNSQCGFRQFLLKRHIGFRYNERNASCSGALCSCLHRHTETILINSFGHIIRGNKLRLLLFVVSCEFLFRAVITTLPLYFLKHYFRLAQHLIHQFILRVPGLFQFLFRYYRKCFNNIFGQYHNSHSSMDVLRCGNRDRTGNLWVMTPTLYLLSYPAKWSRRRDSNPRPED